MLVLSKMDKSACFKHFLALVSVKFLQTECHLFVLNFLGLLKELHVPA
jgi:hypothetical protein